MIPPNDASSYPSPGRARYALLVLASIAVFTTMDMQIVGLLAEPMKHDLGLTDVQLGLAHATSFYVAYGLLATPMGMLVDRLVRVRMLAVAMILWCGGLALTGIATDFWMLAAAKTILGVANAITYPAAMSLVADHFAPSKRAFATMSYPMGQTLGQVGALLVGGLGYSSLVGVVAADPDALHGLAPWRAVPLLFAILGLCLLPLVLAMREPARMEMGERGRGSLRNLWAYRRFLIPLFAGLTFLAGAVSAIHVWFAPALMRLYDLEPGDFAIGFSIQMLVTSVIGFAASGALVNFARNRGGDRLLMLPAAIAAALCAPAAFMALTPNVIWFAAFNAMFAIASGIAISIAVISISFRIPNELRGLTMGLYLVLISITGAIGSPLVGFVSNLLGGEMMLGHAMAAVGAPFALLAGLSFWIATRTDPGVDHPAAAVESDGNMMPQGA